MRSIQNTRTNVVSYLKRFAARRGLNVIQHLILHKIADSANAGAADK